ncbi:protein of unknown function [Xenorhabdus doucetiae]|uniref:Transposase n=1 Tax=Xenorhabdus doucetiae TaxID=351671 RepID=A0A068QTG2_9GAMM|nr:hypothetical protein LY16_02017 [Xenorhabdus doucetiae]CDG18089.1 protein of unknown function [Xenorhabdus doucetiae]
MPGKRYQESNVSLLSIIILSWNAGKMLMADSGYTGEAFALSVKLLCGATVTIAKRSELHMFVVIPNHWMVERSLGWLEKYGQKHFYSNNIIGCRNNVIRDNRGTIQPRSKFTIGCRGKYQHFC